MNEEYLTKLHQHYGVKTDYGTWKSDGKEDGDYVKELRSK